MFKQLVDRTPVMVLGDECEVITYQIKREPKRFVTKLFPSYGILKFAGKAKTLGEAKRLHWQCVDVICECMGCIDIDDNEIAS